jgi:hypothetical protein
MCVTVSSEPHCHDRFCRFVERVTSAQPPGLPGIQCLSQVLVVFLWTFVDPVADVRRFETCVRSATPGVPVSVVWVASFAFARVLVAVMCLLQFFGRLCYCWYCAHTSIVGTRRRLRTSPEGVAPATSGVLVQVCIVLHRFAFAHGFQCQCSGCIPVVFLCARPVTPQIRNGNAQRHNARLLIASSSFVCGCIVCMVVPWYFVYASIAHPLPTRPTDSLERI